MRNKFKKLTVPLLTLLLSITFTFQSCDKVDDASKIIDELLAIVEKTGWLEDKEQLNDIPEDITPLPSDNTTNLKASVNLEDKFPPIGNQGQYGTCVTWAVGYNLKTAIDGIDKGWNQSQLSSKSNQTSPKDLWFAIPSDKKGSKCGGTNFEPAMDALISKGSSDLSVAPYDNLGSCSGSAIGSSNKLANYRKIAANENNVKEGMTLANFKGYLSAGRPIAIGAKLGDRFMDWSSDVVISSDTYSNPGMQHAYHAMVLVGYDDAKSAFRVRNSWGTSWGHNGSIWVDYDFFLKEFCFAAFVAQNPTAASSFQPGNSNTLSGKDLMAFFAEDNDNDDEIEPRRRKFSYEVYNSGNSTITCDKEWSVVYMVYDATNAKNYKIIIEDRYTKAKGTGDGSLSFPSETDALAGGWWNNASIETGKRAGEAEYGSDIFEFTYEMPSSINGKYYLVVMADAFDVIAEGNEDNNFYFITAENGKPLNFENGVVTNMPKASLSKKSNKQPKQYGNTEEQTLVKPGNLNTYTPTEIKTMLLHDKKTGKLEMKMKQFRTKGSNTIKKVSKKR